MSPTASPDRPDFTNNLKILSRVGCPNSFNNPILPYFALFREATIFTVSPNKIKQAATNFQAGIGSSNIK